MSNTGARHWCRKLAAIGAALSLAWLVVPAPTASAVLPGGNGDIFFSQGSRIWRMHADGSGAQPVTLGGENAYAPAVSPDGRFVVYLAVRGDWPGPGLFRIRADGSDELRLTVSLKDGFPSWSPDGRHIVFSRVYSGNTSSLYVMRADGTHEHSIGVAGGWPSYTPDGRRILFGNTDENGGGIYSVRPDGTGLRQLTDTADDESPVASPDGTQILFTRTVVNQGDPDQKDIYKINADGTGEINLTNDPADDLTATWSPDGRRIAFYSERDGRGHLWSMQADGSQPEPLAGSGSIDWEPSWSATPSRCLGQPVTITGTSGPDVLHGTPGPDVISALGGNDRIYGSGGRDVVCAGPGNDVAVGSTGADRLSGEHGGDHLLGGRGRDHLYGGAGRDHLTGGKGRDLIRP